MNIYKTIFNINFDPNMSQNEINIYLERINKLVLSNRAIIKRSIFAKYEVLVKI